MSLLLAVQDLENNYTTAELRIMAKHYRISPRTTREKMITDIAKTNLGVANKKMSVQKASLPPVDKSGNEDLLKKNVKKCKEDFSRSLDEHNKNIADIQTLYMDLYNILNEKITTIDPVILRSLLNKIDCSMEDLIKCSETQLQKGKSLQIELQDRVRTPPAYAPRKPTGFAPQPAKPETSTTSLTTRTFDPKSVEPVPRSAPPLGDDKSLSSLIGGLTSDSGKPSAKTIGFTQTLDSTTESVPGLQPSGPVPATNVAYVPLASDTATGGAESPELQRQSSLAESGELVRPGSERTITVQDILGECSNDEDCERLIGRSEIQELLRGQKVVCVKKVDGKNECVVAVEEK